MLILQMLYLKHWSPFKKNYGNNISLVFGCGGNRDKIKDHSWQKLQITTVRKFMLQMTIQGTKIQKNQK